jgi:hypothetical protein
LLANPFGLRKITTDPHILADISLECPDDKSSKLKIYISGLILDSYEYAPVAHVKCIAWTLIKPLFDACVQGVLNQIF